MIGVIVDQNGDTLAVTEFAMGAGCPDDFIHRAHDDDMWETVFGQSIGTPFPESEADEPPVPSGRWSTVRLQQAVQQASAMPLA